MLQCKRSEIEMTKGGVVFFVVPQTKADVTCVYNTHNYIHIEIDTYCIHILYIGRHIDPPKKKNKQG